jgi:ATP/ADP translocase
VSRAPLLTSSGCLPLFANLAAAVVCASLLLLLLLPPQSLKDAIVVTAGGAETLPFLASFCVLPASLAFFVLYGKLVR